MTLVLIGFAGGAGAMSRWLLSHWIERYQPSRFIPLPILIINVLGSFLLGVSHALLNDTSYEATFLFCTWYLGAFTTFSTFSLESVQLIQAKKWKACILYVGLTTLGAMISYTIGYLILA